jgi:hypothetical protein
VIPALSDPSSVARSRLETQPSRGSDESGTRSHPDLATVARVNPALNVTLVVRVWLPDRPGALGQVASRIGAARGDVTGIEILERGAGLAVDELTVSLPDASLVDLLVNEIRQVEGVSVEEVRPVENGRPEHGIQALEMSAALVDCDRDELWEQLASSIVTLVDADWCAVISLDPPSALIALGPCPDIGWLSAFVDGARHLDGTEARKVLESDDGDVPWDLAWAHLPAADAAVVVGRSGWALRTRERQQISLLSRVADGLADTCRWSAPR